MLNDPVLMNDWHVVAYAPGLKANEPMAVRLLEEDLVLWRVGDKIHAWRDLCVHRGTRTYNEAGQCIRFPAHPTQKPPATACVKTYQVREKYNWIWVCLGNPTQDIPPFAQWDDTSFRKIHCGPYHYNASGPRAIENFLDVTHFPFVHAGYLGDPEHPEINDYEAEVRPDGVTARDITVWQPDPDGSGKGANVTYTYEVVRCLTVAMDYNHLPEDEIRKFEDEITWQDVPIVESQRPELLPLDLQAELHLRSDRTAIAYRKWLRQLGLTFGTA